MIGNLGLSGLHCRLIGAMNFPTPQTINPNRKPCLQLESTFGALLGPNLTKPRIPELRNSKPQQSRAVISYCPHSKQPALDLASLHLYGSTFGFFQLNYGFGVSSSDFLTLPIPIIAAMRSAGIASAGPSILSNASQRVAFWATARGGFPESADFRGPTGKAAITQPRARASKNALFAVTSGPPPLLKVDDPAWRFHRPGHGRPWSFPPATGEDPSWPFRRPRFHMRDATGPQIDLTVGMRQSALG